MVERSMSNHSGSYLIQGVLEIIEELGFFENIEKQKISSLCKKISLMAMLNYDCNPGEIMDKMSPKYGICYHCWGVVSVKEKNDDFHGFCRKCNETCTKEREERELRNRNKE
jgi:hypothetical protein